MLELAHFAKIAAERLEPFPGGDSLVADLQARAWADLANARRVNDDFPGATSALAEAKACLERGSGDPLLLCWVGEVESALQQAQRKLDSALRLLVGVYRLYRELGEGHLAGRARYAMGLCTLYDGRSQRAVELFEEALALLDPERDAILPASARLLLIDALAAQGESLRASRLLLKAGLRQAFAGEPLNLLKVRWVEGRLYTGLGKLDRAQSALEEVHAELIGRDRAYEGALVGLDLAAVYFRQGNLGKVRELAKAKLETFHSLGVPREAMRAIGFLHEACERQRVTETAIVSVREFLARLEWRPYLRFRGV
jgi:tetratricopeptide (TPR) repeat protein